MTSKARAMTAAATCSVLLAPGHAASAAPPAKAPAVAFTHVEVLPMHREVVLHDQTVVVEGGLILKMDDAAKLAPPKGATVIDGRGKFLMPALAEMHAHIPGGKASDAAVERTLFLYAANGIGTIRGMLGDPRHIAYRERAARGELVSPRIYTSGPSLNGTSVPTVESGVKAVTEQKAAGYDFLKIHPGIKRDVYDAIAAKADELSLPFAGHVPLEVGIERALAAHQRSIDHVDGYVEGLVPDASKSDWFGVNLVNDVDEKKLPALVAATVASGSWIVPTQVLFDNLMSDEDPEAMAKRSELQYVVGKDQIAQWITAKKEFLATPAADRKRFLELRRRIIKALYDGGVPFALGSDAPQMWNVPGFSIHHELQSMVDCGLTPYQALAMGTSAVGTYFGEAHNAGTVTAGKRADLMLLGGNPLADIKQSSNIAGVMLGGRYLSKADIDKGLAAEPQ
jgi:hypothetical protein